MSEINNSQQSIEDGIPEVSFTLEVSNVQQAPVDDSLTISGMAADAKATGDAIAEAKADVEGQLATAKTEIETEISEITVDVSGVVGKLFPVGSIYISTSDTAPTFGESNWNWQEIMIPVTHGDLMDGARSYAEKGASDTPGTLHFWLRIADTVINGGAE